MEEDIFISKNSNFPYNRINDLNPCEMKFYISKEEGNAIKIEQKLLFLVICKPNITTSIQLKLSGDSIKGVSILLSNVDSIGIPVGNWNTVITFDNITTTTETIVIPFCYKCLILDNIYNLSAQKFDMNIDLYIDEDL